MTIPDKLLINLKIISKIQKNGRISRSYDGIISLENDIFYQSIKRFISNDSRKQAILEINSVIAECIDTLNYIINSKYMNITFHTTEEYFKNCENIELLLTEIELAKYGIENLKFTYKNDHNISTQIDIIILKTNTILKDFKPKLSLFKSYLNYESNNQTQIVKNQITQNQIVQNQIAQNQIAQNQFHDLTSIKIENETVNVKDTSYGHHGTHSDYGHHDDHDNYNDNHLVNDNDDNYTC